MLSILRRRDAYVDSFGMVDTSTAGEAKLPLKLNSSEFIRCQSNTLMNYRVDSSVCEEITPVAYFVTNRSQLEARATRQRYYFVDSGKMSRVTISYLRRHIK